MKFHKKSAARPTKTIGDASLKSTNGNYIIQRQRIQRYKEIFGLTEPQAIQHLPTRGWSNV